MVISYTNCVFGTEFIIVTVIIRYKYFSPISNLSLNWPASISVTIIICLTVRL